jgi:biofilm PGA synthesis lipoprotein PgaB
VAIEAMPLMEKAENPDAWLADLVRKVAAHPDGLRKTVFELQSVDWNSQSAVSMDFFLKQMRLVQSLGAWHFGYYPDNMIRDYPRLADMRDIMAAPRFP